MNEREIPNHPPQVMAKYRKLFYTILVLLAFISSLVILTGRLKVENVGKNVEIALDYDDLEDMCRREGISPEVALVSLKKAGLTSLAFTETSLNRMQNRGMLTWVTGAQLIGNLQMSGRFGERPAARIKPGAYYVIDYSVEVGEMLKKNLFVVLGRENFSEISILVSRRKIIRAIEIQSNLKDFPSLGIGFDHILLKKAREAGFFIVLRPENRNWFGENNIRDYFDSLASIQGITAVIFGGTENEALGYPTQLDTTVSALKKYGISFGDIEVPTAKVRQKGAEYLGLKIPDMTVRVQSITIQFLTKLGPEDAMDKFRLGVRERNMRLLYLRPFPGGLKGKNALDTNVEYISGIKKELEMFGFRTGAASRFPISAPKAVFVIFIALGAAGIFMLLLEQVYHDGKGYAGIVVVAGALIASVGLVAIGKMYLAQKLFGLTVAIVFPIYAFASHFEEMEFIETQKSFTRALGYALLTFLKISLITTLGGLILAASLSSTTFMLNIDSFSGVKAVLIVPPIACLALYYLKGSKTRQTIKDLLMQNLYMWQVILLGIIGAIGAIYLIRSGNTPDVSASDSELQARVVLEKIMFVRPRFKEFMMGHPAMILTWGLSYLHQYGGLGLFVFFAAMGQADLMDTFAHAHTPVFISLVRILNGAILGAIFGTIALGIYWLGRKAYEGKKN